MKTDVWPWTASLLLAFSGPASGQGAPEEGPAGTFASRLDVTAVELMIDVRDEKGRPVQGLEADSFEVLEDGRPVRLLGVEAPTEPRWVVSSAGHVARGSRRSRRDTWHVLVYFEGSLTDARTMQSSARSLARQAGELTALGAVEVVVADPSPRLVLPFSRDPERLRETLGELAKSPRGGNEVAELRRQFLSFRDMRTQVVHDPDLVEAKEAIGQIRTAVQQEKLIVERQLDRLERWLGIYERPGASALILVSEGFDLDPSEFYLLATTIPEVQRELATELNRYRLEQSAERTSQVLAARGWTGIVLASRSGRGVGPSAAAADASVAGREHFRSIGESTLYSSGPGAASVTSLLQQPLEPLRQLAAATGGEVVTSLRKGERALGRLGERLRLTYQADRPADGELHRLEVRLDRGDLELSAPRWTYSPSGEQVARSRVRRLLLVGGDWGQIPVEVELGAGAGEPQQGARRTELKIFFDLEPLRPALSGPRAAVRFTLGIELPKAPFLHQLTAEVELPERAPEDRLPRFDYTTALALPAEAGRIAVVVEELQTGAWGGTSRSIP